MLQKRKFIYFLGAGASFGAGAHTGIEGGGKLLIPTQATFWGTFLRFCVSTKNRKDIESFLFRYFLGYEKPPARLKAAARRKLLAPIDVEEVFTFLSERVRAPSTSPQLRTYSIKIWEALVSEIGSVFRRFGPNTQTRKIFRSLLENHMRSFDVVVSFNYDTVFEKSLPQAHSWGYGGIEATNNSLLVLKPHGSVNWAAEDDGSIAISETAEKSVVVAPTHLKFVSAGSVQPTTQEGYLDQSVEIQEIWAEMERQMRAARALVFIGYSFPVADLYFSSVLRSVLADRKVTPDIVIVNPDAVAIADRLQRRFALKKVIRYFDLTQFVQASRADVLAQLNE